MAKRGNPHRHKQFIRELEEFWRAAMHLLGVSPRASLCLHLRKPGGRRLWIHSALLLIDRVDDVFLAGN